MNVGTYRGQATAFKLDALLKLVDVKGIDGKTTLLHFVVQEIIRSEGVGSEYASEDVNKTQFKSDNEFRKKGLQVVSGLGKELENVKKAAGMDSDVLNGYVSKLVAGQNRVKEVLEVVKSSTGGKFFVEMKSFLSESENGIGRVKDKEKKALFHVKEITEYFHGDTSKEEAHPLRIFTVVRDFLSVLDQVCREVGKMQERTILGSSMSFPTPTAPIPVFDRHGTSQ